MPSVQELVAAWTPPLDASVTSSSSWYKDNEGFLEYDYDDDDREEEGDEDTRAEAFLDETDNPASETRQSPPPSTVPSGARRKDAEEQAAEHHKHQKKKHDKKKKKKKKDKKAKKKKQREPAMVNDDTCDLCSAAATAVENVCEKETGDNEVTTVFSGYLDSLSEILDGGDSGGNEHENWKEEVDAAYDAYEREVSEFQEDIRAGRHRSTNPFDDDNDDEKERAVGNGDEVRETRFMNLADGIIGDTGEVSMVGRSVGSGGSGGSAGSGAGRVRSHNGNGGLDDNAGTGPSDTHDMLASITRTEKVLFGGLDLEDGSKCNDASTRGNSKSMAAESAMDQLSRSFHRPARSKTGGGSKSADGMSSVTDSLTYRSHATATTTSSLTASVSAAPNHRPPYSNFKSGAKGCGKLGVTFEDQNEVMSMSRSAADSSSSTTSASTPNLPLHEMLVEPNTPDDIAWYNALQLLASLPALATVTDPNMHNWTPLHVCCLSPDPPDFILRALLLCHPAAASTPDTGGRLPLHLAAGSGANVNTIRLLVAEYPNGIQTRDGAGLTPLHMALQNENSVLDLESLRLLLGQETTHRTVGCIPQGRGEASKNLRSRDSGEGNALRRWDTQISHAEIGASHRDDGVRRCFKTIEAWKRKKKRIELANAKARNANANHNASDQQAKSGDISDGSEKIEVTFSGKTECWPDLDGANSGASVSAVGSGNEAGDGSNMAPAAMPAPPHMHLPLHIAIGRSQLPHPPPVGISSLSSSSSFTRLSPSCVATVAARQHRSDILRILINAHPLALLSRNNDGKTPLMMSLTHREQLPDLEEVRLLLGMRTIPGKSGEGVFSEAPGWHDGLIPPLPRGTGKTYLADDLDELLRADAGVTGPAMVSSSVLASDKSTRLSRIYANPAMVSDPSTDELPLHVAASESFPTSILLTLHSAYPPAVKTQDARGQTPFHCALRNVDRALPSRRVVAALLDETVGSVRDSEGRLPFDLLVKSAGSLPSNPPKDDFEEVATILEKKEEEASSMFRRVFSPSILSSAPRSPAGTKPETKFLSDLALLPPWIRAQACSVPFVQKILLDALVQPLPTAIVMYNGILLTVSLVALRLALDSYASSGELQQGWCVPIMYWAGSQTCFNLFCHFAACKYLSVIASHFVLDLRTWIDLGASSLLLSTSALLARDSTDVGVGMVGRVGTAATGLLWWKVVIYLGTWWLDISIVVGGITKMGKRILWSLLILTILIVGFAQMFYTLNNTGSPGGIHQCDTNTVGDQDSICSPYDSYVVVYRLLFGTAILQSGGEGGNERLSVGMVVLIIIFCILAFLLLLNVILSVVLEATCNLDPNDIATESYWTPLLAYIHTVRGGGCAPCIIGSRRREYWDEGLDHALTDTRKAGKVPLVPRPSMSERLQSFLESSWSSLIWALMPSGALQKTDLWWHSNGGCFRNRFCARMMALVILPIWTILGLATLGLLWPPQIRRWLFRPTSSLQNSWGQGRTRGKELQRDDTASLRKEIFGLKAMSYKKSCDLQQEVRELKEMLCVALLQEEDEEG